MTPAMPTGVSSPSQMRQSSPVSPSPRPRTPTVRRTPSRVSTTSPASRAPHAETAAGEERKVVGVGGLTQLEHDVVGRVDHVVDRPHAGEEQPLGHPPRRRPHRDAVQDGHGQARAEVGRLHRRGCCPLDGMTARLGSRGFGHLEGEMQSVGEVAGDARDAPRIRAVALDRDVEDHVTFQADRLQEWRSGLARRVRPEDHQPVAVVAEAQLAARAQHPVRGDPAQLPAGDRLLGLREERADRRERHAVADIEVARAAHDLEWLGTGVDDDQADPVGTLDGTNLEDSAHDDLAQALPHVLDALDDEPEVVERSPQQRRGRRGTGRNHGAS